MSHALDRAVTSLAFSRDSSLLASGALDGTVKLWDMTSGIELASFTGHVDQVSAVAFAPDRQRLVSGSHDKSAIIWEVPKLLARAERND